MNIAAKIVLILIGILALLAIAGWAGLRVRPKPFPTHTAQTPPLPAPEPAVIELSAGLPAPVARYYRTILGERVPVVETAVISGRGRLRIKGATFPARFRFTHVAGQSYRHYIELTFFGRPLMKVNEWYLDGRARMELPMGVIENEPKIDSAANLSLWGEAVWFPSILVTDPRVRWEAIDDVSARLIVPAGSRDGDGEDSFTVSFDPETGLLRRLEAMRWKEPTSPEKIRWRNEPLDWRPFDGVQIPSPAATTWEDEGTPWAVWTVEEIVYNVDVSDYIRARGE